MFDQISSSFDMGSKMDSAALREDALTHAKVFKNMDAKGFLNQGDFEAINTGSGQTHASVPTGTAQNKGKEGVKETCMAPLAMTRTAPP